MTLGHIGSVISTAATVNGRGGGVGISRMYQNFDLEDVLDFDSSED